MGFSSSYPLFLSLFLVFLPLCKPDLESERSALLALRGAVGGKILLWNVTQPSPCTWKGVECQDNSVVGLRLPGNGLSGQLPSGIFGNLTHLYNLSLRLNALTGSLPEDLSSCTDLRNLYLQGNKLSGEIPAFLFKLQNLVRLNLATNNFSGEISPSFNDLNTLRTLYLENNQLTGSIPEIDIPSLVQFNVSFNHLNGSIPSKIRSMPSSSFEGNSLCGGPLVSCPNEGKNKKKLSGGAIAGIVIGSVIGVFLILLILFVLCRKKSNQNSKSMEIAPVKQSSEVEIPTEKGVLEGRSGGYPATAMVPAVKGEINPSGNNNKKLIFFGNVARVFDLEDLLRASAEVLGKGTFGTAYKAVLEMGITVAVKRLKDVTMAEKEFREKIEAVGFMDHENLVPLRAYYFSRDEKLLVYDYMPMGSLSALLHGNRGGGRTPLNWEARSSIALGAARGIEYLHSKGSNISHGNIKSSNILLTKSYDPRVSDFGLNQLVGLSPAPTRIAGYQAPEVTDARKVSQKADVYSFGVLLLELLTGKAPTHALLNEEGVDLPRWVQSVVREEWESEVFDLELLRYQNVEEEMVQLLQLGIDCAAQYPDKRPLMSEVTRRIEELLRSTIGRDERHQPSDLADDDDQTRRTDSIGSGPPPSSNLD